MGDTVGFKRFRGRYTLNRETCECGESFTLVVLEKSDKDSLHVRCANNNCPQHTMAHKKGK
jgi:hypothetical protein